MLKHAVLGLDIGGANLKAVRWPDEARSRAFPLWKSPGELTDALRSLVEGWDVRGPWAVTMTGELADCFRTKADGVRHIARAVAQLAPGPVGIWGTDGRFHSVADAEQSPLIVAAANWHAQATWVGQNVLADGWLIDMGTTTTDLIPLVTGRACPQGQTDVGRLLAGELLYTGVRRTPLCAVAQSVPFRGTSCPVGAELFATTLDVYLLLGQIPEDATDCDTANGRPATREAAHDRIARMLCGDVTEITRDEATLLATEFARLQYAQLHQAWDRAAGTATVTARRCVVSGSGGFLAARVARERGFDVTSLASHLGPALSEAACAYAVAALGQ